MDNMEEIVNCLSKNVSMVVSEPYKHEWCKSLNIDISLNKLFAFGFIKDPKGRPHVYYNPISNIYWILSSAELSGIDVFMKENKPFISFTNFMGQRITLDARNDKNIKMCLNTVFTESVDNFVKVISTLNARGYTQYKAKIKDDIYHNLYTFHIDNGQEYYIHLKSGVLTCGRVKPNGKHQNLIFEFKCLDDMLINYIEMVEETQIENAASVMMSMKKDTSLLV